MGFPGAKITRIVPDQQGRGGSKTSLTSQSINLDTRLVTNAFVYFGRWRRAPQAEDAGYNTAPNVQISLALHNFARFDTTNALMGPINKILVHNRLFSGEHHIDQVNPLATVQNHMPTGADDCVPATFLNIKNRCFVCWGGTENFIYDGTFTYDVGVDQPASSATYTFGGTVTGTAWVTNGGYYITQASGAPGWDVSAPNVKAITIGGISYQTLQPNPIVVTSTAAVQPGTASWTIGTNTVTINGVLWPLNQYNGMILEVAQFSTKFYRINSYVHAGPDTTVNVVSPLVDTGVTQPYGIGGVQAILVRAYAGITSSSESVILYSGNLSWTGVGPKYAYAYYDDFEMTEPGTASGTIGFSVITIAGANWATTRYVGATITMDPGGFNDSYTIQAYAPAGPDTTVTVDFALPLQNTYPPGTAYVLSGALSALGTGHISNISPMTQITEQAQGGVTTILNDIIPSPVDDQDRFNKIQIFRTILASGDAGGAVLFPIRGPHGEGLIENVGTAPLTFTDTFADDFLLINGGLAAPLTTNYEPPPSAHQLYWDGRLWVNPVNDPSAIVYSMQIGDPGLFGVAEECYPSDFILRIPSDDGRVTGMRLVGPVAVITTARYAYYIGGATSSYRLLRFATTTYGVGDYQMTEFAGDTTENSDALAYIGKDKKLSITAPAYGNTSVSDPIQDTFVSEVTNDLSYAACRVHQTANEAQRLILATLPTTTMAYDWDRKLWTNHVIENTDAVVVRPEAWTNLYGGTEPVDILFVHQGTVYKWLNSSATLGASVSTIQTMPMDFGRKSRKRLNFVRIYVSDFDVNTPWKVRVFVDEMPFVEGNFFVYPDPLDSIYGPSAVPVDNPNAKELVYFPQGQVDVPQLIGHRFMFEVIFPDDNGLQEMYALDACTTDMSPQDEVTQ